MFTGLRTHAAHIDETQIEGTNLTLMKAYMPVDESFGFSESLREMTSGQAFPSCAFDHWQECLGDVADSNGTLAARVRMIRERKGMKKEIPEASQFSDKL